MNQAFRVPLIILCYVLLILVSNMFPHHNFTVAVNKLPNFLADPCEKANQPLPLHQCTIHINCENTEMITQAYNCALDGNISDRWGRQINVCVTFIIC